MVVRRLLGLAVMLTVAGVTDAAGQQTDVRWSGWLGCWQLLEERVRDASELDPPMSREYTAVPSGLVCVTPAPGSTGVTLTTSVAAHSALEERIVADGERHPVREPGCEGWQRAEWSSNGRRLFARAELACTDGVTRTISGLGMIGADRIWTDIQVVQERGSESIRVRQYRRAPDQTRVGAAMSSADLLRAAAMTARQAAPLTTDEVKEAVQKLPPSAIEAALMETNTGFPLNSKRLVDLADAGVPGRVIDLMIALSFPNRFIVERRSAGGTGLGYPLGIGSGFGYGSLYDWPYFYAPFGYSLFNRYDTYYYGSPGYAVVDLTPPGPQPSGQGRVIDGQGYTRVRSREPIGVAANGGGSGVIGTHGSSGGSSSGGGSVSGQGYSGGGGGGGDSGRTAVARPPG